MSRWRPALKLSDSLGFRLGSTLVLALLPLGVLSVVQAQKAQREVAASTLEAIAGASLQAVQPQIDLIKEAQISARVLAAALSDDLGEGESCPRRVAAVARDIPAASLVAFIPMTGMMTCSSTGQVFDFSDQPLFRQMAAEAGPSLVFNPEGPVSGTAVVGAGHPVRDGAGTQIGIVAISLPYLSVAPDDYAAPVALWRPAYLATLTGDGRLLVASDPGIDLRTALPEDIDISQLAARSGTPSYHHDAMGDRAVSVTPVARDLFLLAVWERDEAGLWASASPFAPYLLPVLTWLAALMAAAMASGRLVVRHVRQLAKSMSDYMTDKKRIVIPDIADAPREIRRLHAVYEALAQTIAQDEAELQNLLVDKDRLLREVNHRSGNSLQIIAAILRMYRRETSDEALRHVLDGLSNRVIALSSTHTSLYSVTGAHDVPMDQILSGVVRRLKDIHGIAAGVARKDFQALRMPAEAAIPLALALAEIIGCHFAARPDRMEDVVISLTEEDGQVCLSVQGPLVPEFMPETLSGLTALPRRMLHHFAGQLRGTVVIRVNGARSEVDLTFPRQG